jgi:hypothetical protein
VVKLKLAKPNLFPGCLQNNKPLPILQTDGDKWWEITEILEVKVRYRSLWYMV